MITLSERSGDRLQLVKDLTLLARDVAAEIVDKRAKRASEAPLIVLNAGARPGAVEAYQRGTPLLQLVMKGGGNARAYRSGVDGGANGSAFLFAVRIDQARESQSQSGETVTSAWLPRRRFTKDRGSEIEHLAVLCRMDSLHVLIRRVTNMIVGLGGRR